MTREEAIKILNKYDLNFCDIGGNPIPPQDLAEAFDMAIEALQERPQGKWIRRSSVGNWECSLCGGDVITTEPKLANYDYCPYCGAKMEDEEECNVI